MEKKPEYWAGYGFGRVALLVVFLFQVLIGHIGEVEARRPWKNGGGSRAHKFAVKTMKSEEGDIIDCVDIYKQPAFDHPALQNHTIQMEPHEYPSGFEPAAEKATASVRQLQRFEKCPQGTIPLLRNQLKLDYSDHHVLARFRGRAAHMDVDAYGTSGTASENYPNANHEYAIVSTPSGGQYYGAKAVINLWNPSVEGGREFSLSQLWVTNGGYQTNDLNSVEVGWMVQPLLYGDRQTRLFIYWTNSAYRGPGCYNLKCAGFVQTSTAVAIGAAFNPSTYGSEQHELMLTVFKDKSSGNWWLVVGEDQVGYWPMSLFTNLADSASTVQWGGEIVNDRTTGRHTATDMGSGHFPSEGPGKASYFKNIQVVDGSNTLTAPPEAGPLVTNAKCYDIEFEAGGSSFYYGGPGLSDECPEPDVYLSGFEPAAEKATTASVRQLQRFKKCPQGTIPLLRNQLELDYTSEHHVRARFGGRAAHMDVDAYGSTASDHQSSPASTGHEYAVLSTTSGGQYYGAKAVINLWKPSVEGEREFSLRQLWVLGSGGQPNDLNSVEAGWMVHPNLYGDSQTRLFIFWTNSNYQGPGCYNLNCAGFVQTSTEVAMGAAFNPSTDGGDQQELALTVFKDKSSGNWWLMVGEVQVGYWPASLFCTLADSASMVQWGGEIVNDQTTGRHTATDMGSGHFPSEGPGKASYFKNIQAVDGSNTLTDPPPGLGTIGTIVTNAKCYDIEIEAGGSSFYYGGPGLSDECS